MYTSDPKAPRGVAPVRLFPKYEYLLDLVHLWRMEKSMCVLKSRQMVITTLLCGLFLHGLLFEDSFAGLMLSRKDKLVDDGGENSTWDSLFGKIRFMYNHLPDHLRQGVTFTHKRITNPVNGSYIIGESGRVPDSGRGGVYTRALMDECAKIPWSESVFGALTDAAKCILMNSTPSGKAGVFPRIWHAPETRFERYRAGWRKHPDRDDAWYKDQCIDRTPEQIAEELDMSFERSVAGRCVPEFLYERHVDPELQYNPDFRLCAGWDFGIGDPTATTYHQRINEHMLVYGELQRADLTTEEYSPLAKAVARSIGYDERIQAILAHGDPSGRARNRQTGRSDIADYARFGWRILPSRCNEAERFRLFRRLCTKDRMRVHPRCVQLIDCMEQIHYPLDDQGVVISDDHSDTKAHGYSHLLDAFGYSVCALEPVGKRAKPQLVAGV